ncbi:flavin reductase family protein [Streptomyces tubbatahanensis]|uniref:Flavin reductase family protein n=1 Tax=Streptomyces tubbatahanensis TaxID=2923272 RepID=A0ABY3Y2G7_9ACTN|nr:flavin reductase family protein [Streptomyces tubbatahanensis]UNT00811.1 flavin reductase family protein [Streptomyces tubbatahanensis]
MTAPPRGELVSYRAALARWPSGVAVVTARDGGGRPYGFTATAFSSLSAEPPMVLVCLGREADCRPVFEAAEAMAVHLLRDDQVAVAGRFATKNVDKYEGLHTSSGLAGVPLLTEALATIECVLERRIDAGDHIILVGRVERCTAFGGRPLVYFSRTFHSLPADSPAREADSHAQH